MSNHYHRDNEGNWFIRTKKGNISLAFSDAMEIAYQMGKIAGVARMTEIINENFMQVRDSQMDKMDVASVPGK